MIREETFEILAEGDASVIAFVVNTDHWRDRNPMEFGFDWGWGNGYVAVTESHSLYGKCYDQIMDEINYYPHGCLTYAEDIVIGGVSYWAFGFDTSHLDDDLVNWPRDAVVAETIKLYNAVTKPKPMTAEEFFEQYKPVANHIDDNASFDGYMFETFGEEEHFVCTKSPEFIGTYCDGDDGTYIVSGYHLVNRIGYFITELPIPEDLCVTVSLDSDTEESEQLPVNVYQPSNPVRPMWVVFGSAKITDDNGAVVKVGSDFDVVDRNVIVSSEAEAIELYNIMLEDELLYCAGYGLITCGTEPQWLDGGEI